MDYEKLIKENVEELVSLAQNQKQAIVRDRLRFIKLLKTGQAKSQRLAGEQIGLQERQSQRLWQIYRSKGIEGLLSYPYQGSFGKLSTQQISRLRTYLKSDSVDTLQEGQSYIADAFRVNYTLGGISILFKRLKIKLKTGRPVNVRQDQAGKEAFKKNFSQLRAPYGKAIYFQDEMRFGTRTELKRKWGPQSHRPKAPMKIGYEFAYLYLAVCPDNGEIFAMFLPYMNKDCFKLFSQQLAQGLSAATLLIADRASTHQDGLLANTNITLQHLPTACPELNPAERIFKELRKKLANHVFLSIQQAEAILGKALQELIHQPAKVISLTNYSYLNDTSYQN